MNNYIFFNAQGGIEAFYSGNEPEIQDFFGYISVNSHGDQLSSNSVYIPDITNPVITDKPANPTILDKLKVIPNGVDAIQVTDIPLGAKITLGNLTQEATETTATLSFDIAGTYKFKVILFPYLDYEVEIDAT